MTATTMPDAHTMRDGTLVLRPIEPRDVDTLPLNDNMHALFGRIAERNDWTHKGTRAFVAEDQNEPVGYVLAGLGYPPYFPALPEDTNQLYLASFEIFEPFRRRGLGLRLLQLLRKEAERLEVHVFRAECAKGWLVSLYGRVGFEPVPYKGPHEDYPTDQQQMLELWFSPATA